MAAMHTSAAKAIDALTTASISGDGGGLYIQVKPSGRRSWVFRFKAEAEVANHQREIAEAAVAHAIGDKIAAAYQRGDLLEKRRKVMAEWAALCTAPEPAGNVMPFTAAVVAA